MILEFIPESGIGSGAPVRVPVCQVVVRQNNGTPIYAGAEYGPAGAQAHAKAGDPDFNRVLRALGINMTVVVDTLEMPPPPRGARLLTGPNEKG
jgi:hypothetical protein